jgi:DNA polymerase-3 subunit delta'
VSNFIGGEAAKIFFAEVNKKPLRVGSFLFVGPKNTGKASFAKLLARELHGEMAVDPDLMILEGDDNIKIEEVRNLNHFLSLKASKRNRPKIAVVIDANRMTTEAANALLKTLEEPVGESLIILTAISPELLLPTIVSRCLLIRFGLADEKEIKERLLKEGAETAQAEEIAFLSSGRVGEAMRLAGDEEAFSDIKNTLQEVVALLQDSSLNRLVLLNKGTAAADLKMKLERWLNAALLLIGVKAKGKAPLEIVGLNEISSVTLVRLASLVEEALFYLSRNQNANLVLGNLLLELEQI